MRFIWLGLALAGGVATPALGSEAHDWLGRFATAEQRQSFSGIFTYGLAGGFSSHAIWHQVDNGQVQERIVRLDGAPAEALRVGGRLQCASDEFVARVASGNGWRSSRLDPSWLEAGYELTLKGESRVAGRPARILSILPRDQHRYGVELYLDRATALPLKAVMLDDSGALLERYQYARFEPSPVPAEELRPSPECVRVAAERVGESAARFGWRSDWLPPGFRSLEAGVQPAPVGEGEVEWAGFGDGLARFSVFIERLGGGFVPDQRTQVGPTVAVSKRLTTASGEVMVTVVGEIPLGTAERIALSMRPVGQ